ncbi:hypothetical protein NST07_25890 [Paenibacillus sp. FSL L8-0340]|uniref:hypothetical protein n=1 Tax=Paenibacillus sp. FSL L8-0340 TaxID=2954685 RepID=UPI0031599033
MTTIKLTEEHRRAIWNEEPIEIDGETYEEDAVTEEDMDDDGKTRTLLLKRKSDGAMFQTWLYWERYGYEDYSFSAPESSNCMWEVAEVPVTTTEWQTVIERGVHVYEAEYPGEGSYCLTVADFAQKQAEAIAEYGEDTYVVISAAVRTASGWHPVEPAKEDAA